MIFQKQMTIFLFFLPLSALITTLRTEAGSMRLDFYEKSCPKAEQIVFTQVQNILAKPEFKNAPAQLLRLFFHDCFIEGCDASVLLINGSGLVERKATPNMTLKGFQFIDMIKEELEKECPGVVSCSDILVLATRDCISLSGGPYYPLYTGRRDNKLSFFSKALAEIPQPFGNITETLRLFSLRGFNARETVALLGGHNIGIINCQFILPRLSNNPPDPFISPDFGDEIRQKCKRSNSTVSNSEPVLKLRSMGMIESDMSMAYFQELSSSPLHSAFGTHYFDTLKRKRGLLFSDMQLMVNEETAMVVEEYASDDGSTFRSDFARAMIKMSNLVSLIGPKGEVRINCSIALNSS